MTGAAKEQTMRTGEIVDNKMDAETEAAQAGSCPAACSARPFEQQTPLERVLRAHLWQPQDLLKRCEQRLPGLVKTKQYKEAGECQTWISQAKRDIADWEHILSLYESERRAPNDQAERPGWPQTKNR